MLHSALVVPVVLVVQVVPARRPLGTPGKTPCVFTADLIFVYYSLQLITTVLTSFDNVPQTALAVEGFLLGF